MDTDVEKRTILNRRLLYSLKYCCQTPRLSCIGIVLLATLRAEIARGEVAVAFLDCSNIAIVRLC